MFTAEATESLATQTAFDAREVQSYATARQTPDLANLAADLDGYRRKRSRTRPEFLSERNAAKYLGLLTVQLIWLRKLDLAKIDKGVKPQGPPPLCIGGRYTYATDSLDEWILDQPKTPLKQLSGCRKSRTFQ